jgi:hypothetical protein
VRAADDTGGEHGGMPRQRGRLTGRQPGILVLAADPPAARQIRVIVSTLREAAWAEIHIPGRPA